MEELRAARKRLGLLTLLTQLALFLEQLILLLAPALAVLIGFAALSWTGIWLAATPAGRIAGAGALAVLLLLALSRLRHLRWVSRASARAKLDQGREDNPAAALADALANPDQAPTNLLWAAHLRRMRKNVGKLSAPLPAPRLAAQDPRAWGALAILALCATAFVAGPEKYIRLAAAFDWRTLASENSTRVDVWIDPPRYTGKPPIVLTLNQNEEQSISAPVGALIVARAGNIAALGINASEGLEPAPEKTGEKHFVLRRDAHLILSGAARGNFVLHAEPDQPPKIALVGEPKANARGSFTLTYRIDDDYGARDAKIAAKPTEDSGRALFAPPEAALELPAAPGGLGEARATLDWSDSPYAGRPMDLRLSVHDEAGQEGEARVGPFALPQKTFRDPLAQALVEQRRILALDAERRGQVNSALEALDIAPELFTPKLSVHLGLRQAILSLRHAQNDDDLREVADYLWAMALQIEEGDMSQAERDLRAAEKALREAMKNGASKEEIDRLTKDMQKAMENFLQEMAKKGQQRQGESQTGEGKAVSPEDFQKLLEQMKKAMEEGDMETAQALLDQMQSMLENLQNAQGGPSQKSRDRQSRRDLDKMMREQQQLRDETAEQERRKGAPGAQGREQDQQGESQKSGKGKGESDKPGESSLEQRQSKLREKLDALRKNAPGMDEKAAEGLKQAEEAMKDAENALKQGDEAQAMSEQQRALDQMGKSAGEMAKGKDGEGQEAGGEKRGGRDKNGEGPFDNAQRSDGVKATAAQKARRILDELRKRLSDPSRAQEELDYLERLIRPN
ncbi:uncharacterized protein (TIGR02302 family) [Rhodoblastus acidophilus]|uniref:TIGR02302 family protein n=1 Tax=Rhodoblastus acidophilus TaxID=1074 RepID=UPI002224FA86|nr:TIGR02302 family protein [Rhodoblastus acidophilus]MCW2283295.1 uncharacterized protein (TIGR02302 family) [Rhodoblastus acidophilus]MCW2332155.1 uncharacterized protein (TIGR02302 family) [Rhodoblastus acidophilus]